jgi:hypothetical protein
MIEIKMRLINLILSLFKLIIPADSRNTRIGSLIRILSNPYELLFDNTADKRRNKKKKNAKSI